MKRKFRNDCLENSSISRRMSEQQNDSNEQGNLNSFINFAKYRNNVIVRCRFSREPNTSKSDSVYKRFRAHNRNIRLFFILISCSLKCEFHSVDVLTFRHLFCIFAHHFIPITAAAMSWAESFGSQPDCDDDESRIDVEQAVNSVIARGKR